MPMPAARRRAPAGFSTIRLLPSVLRSPKSARAFGDNGPSWYNESSGAFSHRSRLITIPRSDQNFRES